MFSAPWIYFIKAGFDFQTKYYVEEKYRRLWAKILQKYFSYHITYASNKLLAFNGVI
jgi:hypothetical protein